jgi:iron complex outermembrane receptor protein
MDADGFSDYESLDFLAAQRVEVWKGANALRYGGNTSGGAVNLFEPSNGRSVVGGIRVRF